MGEDLDSLALKDLQNIEQQLDSALKQIRARKVFFKYFNCYILNSIILSNIIGIGFADCIPKPSLLQNQLMHESISELHKKVILYLLSSQLFFYFFFPIFGPITN